MISDGQVNSAQVKVQEVQDPGLPVFAVNEAQLDFLQLLWKVLKISPYKSSQLKLPDSVQGSMTRTSQVTFLPDLHSVDVEVITSQVDELLFERLMMDPQTASLNIVEIPITESPLDGEVSESNQFKYLFHCYHRCKLSQSGVDIVNASLLEKAIINQAAMYLNQSFIYPGFNPSATMKIIKLIDEYSESFDHRYSLPAFLESLTESLYLKHETEATSHPRELFSVNCYNALGDRLEKTGLADPNLLKNLDLIKVLTSGPKLCQLFMDMSSPWRQKIKYDFVKGLRGTSVADDIQRTVIGKLLTISCLTRPGPANSSLEFFDAPSRTTMAEMQATERSIATQIRVIVEGVQSIFLTLLKHKNVKNELLNWIGLTLHAFKDRSKMWTNEAGAHILPTDGFALNLSYVLLLLCKPFAEPYSVKLLKVDPRYVVGKEHELNFNTDAASTGIFMREFKKETMIGIETKAADGEEAATPIVDGSIPDNFNFMTEIFFMAHKSIEIGFKSCNERLLRLTTDLNHLSRAIQDANAGGASSGNPMIDQIQREFEKQSTIYFSLKAMLTQEHQIDLMIKFSVATATWINNLAASKDFEDSGHGFKKITSAIINEENGESENLKLIPEFVVDNVTTLIIFMSRFLERLDLSLVTNVEPLMTLVLMFMGSTNRTKNPHLRARFAEILQLLIPESVGGKRRVNSIASGFNNFVTHPNAGELVPSLLRCFVSIEKTDHFEQKFQYRQPMYAVLKYLWKEVRDPHRERMKSLATEAEATMDSMPSFLRFINLLINDANHLLAEALDYMKKLKAMEAERDAGNWNAMNQQQRRQQEANYEHQGKLAQFHNVMSRDTIETLSWLTSEVRSIFYHPTLAPRIAQTLNYFLKFLVGPSSKEFKVKDMKEYHFKPANIVHDICLIYTHLSSNDFEENDFNDESRINVLFCNEVASDSRSYSTGLLSEAGDVLLRTGKSENGLGLKMKSLSGFIDNLSAGQALMEINVDDIPDEFLDPIMSTLMTDPVKLPSGYILDRSTIARHLLSDQNDPFTRQPLTMDMVVQQDEVKSNIVAFIEEYNRKRSEAAAAAGAPSE